MTLNKILNSIQSIEKMITYELPVREAYKIYSLAKTINEKREFFINEEKKLINKYNAEILETGEIKFQSIEDKNNYIAENQALREFEFEDIKPLDLSFSIFDKINFTPADFIVLDGVINFID